MGFHPWKAKPDIWMWQNGSIYKYIGVYVDDIAAAAKDSKAITYLLQDMYQEPPVNLLQGLTTT